MAIKIGTATGFLDFLDQLKDFVVNPEYAGWTELFTGHDYDGITQMTRHRSGQYKIYNGATESYATFYDNERIDFSFTEAKEVGSIKVTMPSLSGGGTIANSPKTIDLYYGPDGVSWTMAKSWENLPAWGDYQSETFVLDTPVTAKWWYFRVRNSNSSNYAYVAEVEYFNASGVRHYINYQGDETRGRCKRFFAQSPFIPSGEEGAVRAHLQILGYISPRENNYTLGIFSYSDLYEYTEEGSSLPRVGGRDGAGSYCYLRDTEMEYWFYGDTRQFYGFVRVGSTIQQFGTGYSLPYATPQQYALSTFVGAANSSSWNNYENDTDYNIRGFTNPGNGSLYAFNHLNAWQEVQNYDMYIDAERLNPNSYCLWPGNLSEFNSLRNSPGVSGNDGNYILYPLIIKYSGNSVLGELKNIYLVPGTNLTSGDTITVGGETYRVFQNQWRTSQYDFCAVKEE